MRLATLLEGLGKSSQDVGDLQVFHITHDSRRVEPGSIFVALEGARYDGHHYIDCALQQGCIAVVTSKPEKVRAKVPVLQVQDPRLSMAKLARRLYEAPDEKLTTIGVTGTNGKTTTTFLVQQILNSLGHCGRLGTLTYYTGVSEEKATRTTPESPVLYRCLKEMVRAYCRYAAMEISSHALTLHRTHGLKLDYAIFTNLTQDHLDFHGDMSAYFEAKCQIFDHLRPGATAIWNQDDPWATKIKLPAGVNKFTFGQTPDCDLSFSIEKLSANGTELALQHKGQTWRLQSPLLGSHNAYNLCGAIAVGLLEGLDQKAIQQEVQKIRPIAGRMEPIDTQRDFGAAVDFAHTPDALEKVATCCKEIAENRLILVFGAGGDRDKEKRPLMGQAADRIADLVILTSDNPRGENPQAIIADIQAGIQRKEHIMVEPDRRLAISRAFAEAKTGDFILLAGKGHETTQEISGKFLPFNDREEAIRVLRGRT